MNKYKSDDYKLGAVKYYDYWEDNKNEKYENKTNIRLCPVCRS
jgi:hypothetical protein